MLVYKFELSTEANPTSECILISLRSLIILGGVLNTDALGKLINWFRKMVKNLVKLWAGACRRPFTTGLCSGLWTFVSTRIQVY